MPYTQVQFIAYVLRTGPVDTPAGTRYLGLKDPAHDIAARCALMSRALQVAHDNLTTASPPEPPGTTLKVFMAPEFFFRGKAGAYDMDDVQRVISALQAIAADDSWADWVFAFGTILGRSAPPPRDVDPPLTEEIYNFALIQEGGEGAAAGPGGARMVMKELMSTIDFIDSAPFEGGLVLGDVVHMGAGPTGPGREAQRLAYDGAGIFELRGFTWAGDICLDHLGGRLLRSPQLPGERVVQIQLIPSAGARITGGNVIAGLGGYVFNVDGNGNGSDLQSVTGPGTATKIAAVSHPVPDDDISLAGVSPPIDVPVADLYQHPDDRADDAGKILIYPAGAAPPVHEVPGSSNTLTWGQDPERTFKFELIYDENDDVTQLLFEPIIATVGLRGRKYFLPLNMAAKAPDGRDVTLQIELRPGGDGYQCGVWCDIRVPGLGFNDFGFNGFAVEFDGAKTGKPPRTCWGPQ